MYEIDDRARAVDVARVARRAPARGLRIDTERHLDPLGFSLENFDAIGQWRTSNAGTPIDASGQLADGTQVDGPIALRKAIMKHPEQFDRTMAEKMLTYGLGRRLEYYDKPVVRGIERASAKDDYRFSALVMNIVKSAPFQMRKAQEAKASEVRAAR